MAFGCVSIEPPSASWPTDTFGLKVVSVFPGNHGTAYDSHQGVVMLFETEHGSPVRVLSPYAGFLAVPSGDPYLSSLGLPRAVSRPVLSTSDPFLSCAW